jgi:uncharacterized protein (DUF2345 family)
LGVAIPAAPTLVTIAASAGTIATAAYAWTIATGGSLVIANVSTIAVEAKKITAATNWSAIITTKGQVPFQEISPLKITLQVNISKLKDTVSLGY